MKNRLIITLTSIAFLACFGNTITMDRDYVLTDYITCRALIKEFIKENIDASVDDITIFYQDIKTIIFKRIKKYPYFFPPHSFKCLKQELIKQIKTVQQQKDRMFLPKNETILRYYNNQISACAKLLPIIKDIEKEHMKRHCMPTKYTPIKSIQTSSGRTVKPPLLFKAGPATSKPE